MFITLLCFIMGLTLLLFFLYHCSLVRKGVTTNEKLKISGYLSGIEKKIKSITNNIATKHTEISKETDESAKSSLSEEVKKEEKKIRTWEKKYLAIKSFGNQGFMANLKEIFNAN